MDCLGTALSEWLLWQRPAVGSDELSEATNANQRVTRRKRQSLTPASRGTATASIESSRRTRARCPTPLLSPTQLSQCHPRPSQREDPQVQILCWSFLFSTLHFPSHAYKELLGCSQQRKMNSPASYFHREMGKFLPIYFNPALTLELNRRGCSVNKLRLTSFQASWSCFVLQIGASNYFSLKGLDVSQVAF